MMTSQKISHKVKNIKWVHFTVEVILIVLAINIGLWFSNLNDQRHEKELETRILNELLISLQSDKADITLNIITHKQGIQAGQNLLSQDPVRVDLDFDKEINEINSWTFLLADLSTYESLKSIGFLLISDDDVRRKMTKLYNVGYKNILELETNHKRICQNFELILLNQLVAPNQPTSSTQNEAGTAKSPSTTLTVQQVYIIKQLIQSHSNMKSLYESEILLNLNDLIESIELALINRS